MGTPIVCPQCSLLNGLLVEECRCGQILTRDGHCSRARGSGIPGAAFETENPSNLWRTASTQHGEAKAIDAHEFLGYCLILRAVSETFEQQDHVVWFDDCLFFLRGGYPFLGHLNLTTGLFPRARVFGGLKHGKRPRQRLEAWLDRIIGEAAMRDVRNVDVFVLDEANSGTGANRLMSIVRRWLQKRVASTMMQIMFHYLLICPDQTDELVPDVVAAFNRSGRGNMRRYSEGGIDVTNRVLTLGGPIITYDKSVYSGLNVISKANEEIERYEAIRYATGLISVRCPVTHDSIFAAGNGDDDAAHAAGMLAIELLSSFDVAYGYMLERVARGVCLECKRLFERLRASEPPCRVKELIACRQTSQRRLC